MGCRSERQPVRVSRPFAAFPVKNAALCNTLSRPRKRLSEQDAAAAAGFIPEQQQTLTGRKMIMAARFRTLRMEQMEARQMMAGDVTASVVNGNLILSEAAGQAGLENS